jgi:hypothetical protein
MTHRLEDKLICGGVTRRAQLSAADQARLEAEPALEQLLAENAALAQEQQRGCPPPPDRARLLAAAVTNYSQPKEQAMVPNPVYRLFSGKPLVLRLAVGSALLVAIFALSQLLPRPGALVPVTPAWAATEGALLAFDFGDADLATIQPLIDQLKDKVTAFKTAHNLPTGEAHSATGLISSERKMVIKHEDGAVSEGGHEQETKRAIVMVQLPDATLVDELKQELASIPGLPVPEVTDATWFTRNGLPDPTQPGINVGLNFGEKQHMFNFPQGTGAAQMESEINSWIAQNEPDFKGSVKVTVSGDEHNRRVEVRVESTTVRDGSDSSSAGGNG